MASGFVDLFSDRPELYAAARPRYPESLFEFIAAHTPARDCAWDCATGNGQAATSLARHFTRVEATDASASQVAHAAPVENVRYSVQPAEATSFPDASFDAVTVAQAVHWFDLERFHREVQRVLRPRGVYAIWGYDKLIVSADFDAALRANLLEGLKPFWAKQNAIIWGGYAAMPFPFEPLAAPPFEIRMEWNFAELLAYLRTWSAVAKRTAQEGGAFFEAAARALAPHWGDPESKRTVVMPMHVRCGRRAP
jgi:SAM-dependent methyltransferase